jgi:TonB family protein
VRAPGHHAGGTGHRRSRITDGAAVPNTRLGRDREQTSAGHLDRRRRGGGLGSRRGGFLSSRWPGQTKEENGHSGQHHAGASASSPATDAPADPSSRAPRSGGTSARCARICRGSRSGFPARTRGGARCTRAHGFEHPRRRAARRLRSGWPRWRRNDRRPRPGRRRRQNAVTSALRTHRATRSSTLSIKARIWVDGSGRVTRASLEGSSGDREVDEALRQEILAGLQLPDPPPEGMPMPIVMRINAARP